MRDLAYIRRFKMCTWWKTQGVLRIFSFLALQTFGYVFTLKVKAMWREKMRRLLCFRLFSALRGV